MKPGGDLFATIVALGRDERRVLGVLARRLLDRQMAYGGLDLIADGRDWRTERADDPADALVSAAIVEVAETLAASRDDGEGAR